jgi:uncharacterized protein (AIM24 family)
MQADIKGSTMPTLDVSLDQGESVVTPHAELVWMTTSMHMSQTMSGGGQGGGGGGFMGGLKRVLGGAGLFLTRYDGPGLVTFAAKFPGAILPVQVGGGQSFLVHKHGWLCGTPGITASVGLQQSFRGGMFGGEGFILQKLDGEGTAWIELSGEVTTYNLPPGETMLAHPGHIGMFQASVQFSITRMPGIANMAFGGDGLHLVALTGPGTVWLQSMPLPLLADALAPYLSQDGGQEAVGGGMAGGAAGGMLGDFLRG